MRKLVFALSTLVFFCGSASALEVPEKTFSYVNDYAAMLSTSARVSLEELLAAFDKETSNQLVVATFRSLEGGSLEDFSIRLAEKWKPGDEKKDNGILLVIFKEDREVRIEVGYGLEGALPDAIAKRIIEKEIVPRFKQGDFDGGVTGAADALMRATRGEYQASASVDEKFEEYSPFLFTLMVFYMVLPLIAYLVIAFIGFAWFSLPGLGGALLLILILEALRKSLLGTAGKTYTGRRGAGGWSSGGFGGGFGGGGFSGGGGGFGGGGASGRW